MIHFDVGDTLFTYRVAGVCIEDRRVLLHRGEADDFWALPGGRCEIGEDAASTLAREMREEIGATVTVGPLRYVVENFFTHWGRRFHELGLYFACALPTDHPFRDLMREHEGIEDMHPHGAAVRLIFRWFPVASLGGVPLYPAYLREALAMPPAVRHIVQRDA